MHCHQYRLYFNLQKHGMGRGRGNDSQIIHSVWTDHDAAGGGSPFKRTRFEDHTRGLVGRGAGTTLPAWITRGEPMGQQNTISQYGQHTSKCLHFSQGLHGADGSPRPYGQHGSNGQLASHNPHGLHGLQESHGTHGLLGAHGQHGQHGSHGISGSHGPHDPPRQHGLQSQSTSSTAGNHYGPSQTTPNDQHRSTSYTHTTYNGPSEHQRGNGNDNTHHYSYVTVCSVHNSSALRKMPIDSSNNLPHISLAIEMKDN